MEQSQGPTNADSAGYPGSNIDSPKSFQNQNAMERHVGTTQSAGVPGGGSYGRRGGHQMNNQMNHIAGVNNLNMNRLVLYKRGHFLDSSTHSYFIIEISQTADGSLFFAAFDIQSNASLVLHKTPD